MKKKLLITLTIIACLAASGTAIVVKLGLDSLNYRYDPETVKARQIERTRQWVVSLREQPATHQPIGVATTPETIGPAVCDALLSDALTHNSEPPKIDIANFADGPDGKLWIDIAVHFHNGTTVVIHTYQEGVTNCDKSP